MIGRATLRFVPSLVLALLAAVPQASADQAGNPVSVDSGITDVSQTPNSGRVARVTLTDTPSRIGRDQKSIWTFPKKINLRDTRWLLPLAAGTGVLIGADQHISSRIQNNPSSISRANVVANAGLGAFGAASLALYGIGSLTGNEHKQETGLLMGEAMFDSWAVVQVLKLATARPRPSESISGRFWRDSSPLNSSFPSDHAALSWAAATVLAHEYPGPLTKWTAYGLAAAVSTARIVSQEHFPSDVLVGAAAGYLIGKMVYRSHHNRELDDQFGTTPVLDTQLAPQSGDSTRQSQVGRAPRGSVYVTLDSWVYPALKRLAALGYVPDQDALIAPWTRLQCLHQIEEAEDIASERNTRRDAGDINEEALRLIADLKAEFAGERDNNEEIRVESVYTNSTFINGTPLRDSFHFGQTIVNNFGRPYDEGASNYTGFSAYADSGRFFAYVRGEYNYAPGREAYSRDVREFISGLDGNPVQGPDPTPRTSEFTPLEMYAGMAVGKFQVSFGKQSLWWGPGSGSALHFGNNAAPFYMLRFSQTSPVVLPGPLRLLGRIRTELLFGKLSGHEFPPRPFINAQKITFQFTDDLEVGLTRSAVFAGVGHPFTFRTFYRSLFSGSSTGSSEFGSANDPGDRRGSLDFWWRLPGLRRHVTIYSDSLSDDDPNPLANPTRAAWGPGIYLTQLPGLRKMDFRFETYSTLLYAGDKGGAFFYINNQYHDGFTNKGNILGSWVGRDSRAYMASTTYWFSAASTLEAQYKQVKAGNFLPGGGTQTDLSLNGKWRIKPECQLGAFLQYERYAIPVLAGPQRDVAGGFSITLYPKDLRLRR